MTNPTGAPSTEATPEAVQQLAGLPEYELTPDGKVLPVQNQAAPSTQASPAGAETEPVGSPAEPAQPAPQTTPQPAVQVVPPPQTVGQPAQQPAVQVVEPQQPAQAPVEPAPQAQAPEPTPEELAAAQQRRDDLLGQQLQEKIEAALRMQQSGFDKRAAQLDRQLQEAATREQELTRQMRELQAQGLPEEERQKLLDRYSIEDELQQLNTYRTQLVDFDKSVMVDALVLEFGEYGVTREAIEQFESPEEMEVHCYDAKAGYLEQKLQEAQQQPAQPAAQQPAQQPAQAPAEPASPPQPQVPAGALAPADLSVGGGGQQPTEPSQEANPEAFRQNLRNLDWKTVVVRR